MEIKEEIKNYILVDSINECIKVVEEILLKEAILAIDCEGIYLSKDGRLMLIQVKLALILDQLKR